MQAFDLDSQSPEGPFDYPPSDQWSIPVARIAGTRVLLSYSVLIAVAVSLSFFAMIQNRSGDRELTLIAAAAGGVWILGWIVQLAVFLILQLTSSAKSGSLTIGLLGVDVGYPLSRPYCWSAGTNLFSYSICMMALTFLGFGCLIVHVLTAGGEELGLSNWFQTLRSPNFGMESLDNGYLAAAWVLWFQAAFQSFPLPRNLGRGATASAVALLISEADEDLKFRLLKRTIQLIAIATLVIAFTSLLSRPTEFVPVWPLLVFLALLLWYSSNRSDLLAWLRSIEVANSRHPELRLSVVDSDQEPGVKQSRVGQFIESLRMVKRRRLARAALIREREEALDVARLDQVLEKVGKCGRDGLSSEDQALLQRVSQMLREDRQSKPNGSDGSDSGATDEAKPTDYLDPR